MDDDSISICEYNEPPFTSEGYTFYSPEDHIDRPKMQWLIDGVLPRTGLACVFGSPGSGKSFLILDMAAKVALGHDWFGRKTTPCSVLYIALEGKHGFYGRIKAWEAHNQTEIPSFVRFMYDSFDITNGEAIGKLVVAIRECDEDIKLVIIDTLNRASPGCDENSSKDMGEIIRGASVLQSQINGLVLLVHHDGKDATRGLRGHSSLLGALDTALKITVDGNLRQWCLAKQKDGQDGIQHNFKLAEAAYETADGNTVTSLAINPEGTTSIAEKPRKPLGKNQATVLASIRVVLTGYKLEGLPAQILFEDAVKALQDKLPDVDIKHRSTRTRDALQSLCTQGYLLLDDTQNLSLAEA